MSCAVNFSKTYFYKLHSLTNTLDKVFDRVLLQHANLSLSQFLLLITISQHESINQRKTAHYLHISSVAVKRQVDIAKRSGWIEVVDLSIRGEALKLTPSGEAALQDGLLALEQHVFSVFDQHNRSANLMTHINILLSKAEEVEQKIGSTQKQHKSIQTRKGVNYANSQSS